MAKSLLSVLKALSDRNRLRILAVVSAGETCVCDIERALGLTQSNASRHLTRLRQSGLISSRKRGLFVYYRLRPGLFRKHRFLGPLLKSCLRENRRDRALPRTRCRP